MARVRLAIASSLTRLTQLTVSQMKEVGIEVGRFEFESLAIAYLRQRKHVSADIALRRLAAAETAQSARLSRMLLRVATQTGQLPKAAELIKQLYLRDEVDLSRHEVYIALQMDYMLNACISGYATAVAVV